MGRCIGILGGTFNPIHNGHLKIAEEACRQYELDEMWFLPNYVPPHKESKGLAELADERVDMLELAIEGKSNYSICYLELERKGYSYTYETMERLHRDCPEDHFYFIIGGDSLFQLESWKYPERILKCCSILAAARLCDFCSSDAETFYGQIRYLKDKFRADILPVEMPFVPISSTEIREKVSRGESVSELVPAAVAAYIREKNIYTY